MIDFIKGTVAYTDTDTVVIENNGIGFKILTSAMTLAKVCVNQKATLYTYMNVREDDISLFGFLTRDELETFKLLITVNGIGPKVALAILSVLSVDELKIAIISNDSKTISQANGVGAKTAARLCMELKDKFKLEDTIQISGDDLSESVTNDIITEAAMALTSLGYTNSEALKAIKKVKDPDSYDVEGLIKAALKNML